MLTLYIKSNCAFSAMALKKVEDLGLKIDEKNIADLEAAEELLAKGGKLQALFLVDDSTGTSLYESADIVSYLEDHYGKGKAEGEGAVTQGAEVRVHQSENADVCEVSE